MSDAKTLIQLKERIEKAKSKLSSLDGSIKVHLDSLKKYGCKTTKEATKKLKELTEQKAEVEAKITKIIDRLDNEYGDLI